MFDEVKRVLKKTGTVWVNIGDTYSGMKIGNTEEYKNPKVKTNSFIKIKQNFKDKCLLQIPSRFSIEMCNRGWILRNEIIWYKPNCMPQSVKDRFTVDFEKIFFFVKNKKYWFEKQIEGDNIRIRKGTKHGNKVGKGVNQDEFSGSSSGRLRLGLQRDIQTKGRNKRCVWRIPPKPFSKAHFAVFPEGLIETPIKAGCPKNGVCLDPFMGSGTTALVALKQGRKFVGIELNPDYIKIAEDRIRTELNQQKLFA